jgi:hypothetical protein
MHNVHGRATDAFAWLKNGCGSTDLSFVNLEAFRNWRTNRKANANRVFCDRTAGTV